MGTSKSYTSSLKGQPQWGQLSSSMTRNCVGGKVPQKSLSGILSNYSGVVQGSKRSGSGGNYRIGTSAVKAAQGLGGFFNSISSDGEGRDLQAVLTEYGLDDLSGKTVSEVVNFLLEKINGVSSTKDDSAAKEASRKILEEFADRAKSIDDLEENLKKKLENESVEEILIKYYGYYIHEDLSRMFYEKLVKEKGKTNCNGLFREIKDYIMSRLARLNKEGKLKKIDFSSDKWKNLIKDMHDRVIKIFGNE